jgi:CO dehydrogenase maturation factor
MGRPEGAGCYCAANTLLTQYLSRLIDNYTSVVIDNEAGMEHISRLTTNNIDLLIIVSDASRRGILSAARISELTDELGVKIDKKLFIINQVKEEKKDDLIKVAKEFGLNVAGIIPEDKKVRDFDLKGIPTIKLEHESESIKAAYEIFDSVLF